MPLPIRKRVSDFVARVPTGETEFGVARSPRGGRSHVGVPRGPVPVSALAP